MAKRLLQFAPAVRPEIDPRRRAWLAAAAGAAALCAGAARAAEPEAGAGAVLLVAAAALAEGLFARSVVVATGAPGGEVLGVIVNQPTSEALPDWARPPGDTPGRVSGVHRGGPLAPQQAFALVEGAAAGPASLPVGGTVRLVVGTSAVRSAITAASGRARLFRGYAGWASGQLAGELAGGFWLPRAVDADLLFDPDPASLWQRLGGGAT